ncbi:hypothetical protein [uncultured Thiohalocapsa sp.]|uniref:hypothetical protein n=1 Tax=uncultured Thiohalocapsa sp. TaxID=768990 RepID=UPI0025FAEA0E|nr:hypothetical protein [uncultured Thiohalocapsa sp.]
MFEQMDDAYLRERAADIRDIGQRVLAHMQAAAAPVAALSEPCLLIGETLGLAEIVAVEPGCLAGLVALRGSVPVTGYLIACLPLRSRRLGLLTQWPQWAGNCRSGCP